VREFLGCSVKEAKNHYQVLKKRFIRSEFPIHAVQLKLEAADGKHYLTDALDIRQAIRIIMLLESPAAEKFKNRLTELALAQLDPSQTATIVDILTSDLS